VGGNRQRVVSDRGADTCVLATTTTIHVLHQSHFQMDPDAVCAAMNSLTLTGSQALQPSRWSDPDDATPPTSMRCTYTSTYLQQTQAQARPTGGPPHLCCPHEVVCLHAAQVWCQGSSKGWAQPIRPGDEPTPVQRQHSCRQLRAREGAPAGLQGQQQPAGTGSRSRLL
jgi:hypothetical protein